MSKIKFIVTFIIACVIVLWIGYSIKYNKENPGGEICAQVITQGRNPKTGEVRNFPTPCDVPEGWDTLEGDGNQTFVENGITYKTFWNSDLGISFSYKLNPNGYTLLEKDLPNKNLPRVEKYINLVNTADYNFSLTDTGAHDGPPFIYIMIFDNKENLSAKDWLVKYGKTLGYKEDSNEKAVNLGGVNGLRYSSDGLYMQDIVVMNNNYKIYVVSGDSPGEDSQIRADYIELLGSLTFF